MIEVVSAVIITDGRVLLTQRRADQEFAFTWESPGGKVEIGESHIDALIRELREEIGVYVDAENVVPHPLWRGVFRILGQRPERLNLSALSNEVSPSRDVEDPVLIEVSMYFVRMRAGKPRVTPCEGQGLGWFSQGEMAGLTLAPGNNAALGKIVSAMSFR